MPARVIRTALLVLLAAALVFTLGWALGDLVVGNRPLQILSDPGRPLHRASS